MREDYETALRIEGDTVTKLTLPRSNVVRFLLDDGSWLVLRPSGTEPKLKIYIGVVDDSRKNAETRLKRLGEAVLAIVETIS